MPSSGDIFLSATEVANNPKTFLVVNAEGRDIEQAILTAADAGLMTTYVSDSIMTDTVLPSFVTIGSVSVLNNKIVLNNHGFKDGTQILFSTSATMPTPLVAGSVYYVKVVDTNSFQVCSSYLNVVNNVVLVIATAGSGTIQVREFSKAEQFNNAWIGQGDTDLNRPLIYMMNIIIAHFTNLGYTITRQTNPNADGVFWWIVRW